MISDKLRWCKDNECCVAVACTESLVSANVSLWPIDHTTALLCCVFIFSNFYPFVLSFTFLLLALCHCDVHAPLKKPFRLIGYQNFACSAQNFIKLVTLSPGGCFYKFQRYKMSFLLKHSWVKIRQYLDNVMLYLDNVMWKCDICIQNLMN